MMQYVSSICFLRSSISFVCFQPHYLVFQPFCSWIYILIKMFYSPKGLQRFPFVPLRCFLLGWFSVPLPPSFLPPVSSLPSFPPSLPPLYFPSSPPFFFPTLPPTSLSSFIICLHSSSINKRENLMILFQFANVTFVEAHYKVSDSTSLP